ncbi:MAG: hypothetical protein MUD01_15820 [Chloroflexaceae bacterium]|jgi:hypothetical protein|nr:hypothetical protein [Chloroflexaceae bacterium]
MEQPHPLVRAYYDTILGFEPPAYAKMNRRGAIHKYSKVVIEHDGTRVYPPLTRDLIQAHLRGDITVAACLVDPDGLARAAALDIDAGGEALVRRVLELATLQGFRGFAQTSVNDEHQGGHIWFLFKERTEPERLRRLAQQLAQQAGISAETYPTKKTIRLPLGVHRWTGQRGRLLLPDDHVLDLDTGEYVVRQAVRLLRDLPQNEVVRLPHSPTRTREPEAPPVRPHGRSADQSFIRHYNQSVNLVGLLERSGGRIAQHLFNGGVLMHCPCPHHKHADARPSLELRPAKNRSRYGEFVAFGYAPQCVFYTESGQVIDAFSVWCALEGLPLEEAIEKLKA